MNIVMFSCEIGTCTTTSLPTCHHFHPGFLSTNQHFILKHWPRATVDISSNLEDPKLQFKPPTKFIGSHITKLSIKGLSFLPGGSTYYECFIFWTHNWKTQFHTFLHQNYSCPKSRNSIFPETFFNGGRVPQKAWYTYWKIWKCNYFLMIAIFGAQFRHIKSLQEGYSRRECSKK